MNYIQSRKEELIAEIERLQSLQQHLRMKIKIFREKREMWEGPGDYMDIDNNRADFLKMVDDLADIPSQVEPLRKEFLYLAFDD